MNIVWGIIYENGFAGGFCMVWIEAEHLYTRGWKFLWMIHTYRAGIAEDMASLEKGISNLRKHWVLWWILSQDWTHGAVREREVVLGAGKASSDWEDQAWNIPCCLYQHSCNLHLGPLAPLVGMGASRSNGKLCCVIFPPPGVPPSSSSGLL